MFRFPDKIDLRPFISEPSEGAMNDKIFIGANRSDAPLEYELCALLLHRGPTANAGHYMSHIHDLLVLDCG